MSKGIDIDSCEAHLAIYENAETQTYSVGLDISGLATVEEAQAIAEFILDFLNKSWVTSSISLQ